MIKTNTSCAIISLLIAVGISVSFKMNHIQSKPKVSHSMALLLAK